MPRFKNKAQEELAKRFGLEHLIGEPEPLVFDGEAIPEDRWTDCRVCLGLGSVVHTCELPGEDMVVDCGHCQATGKVWVVGGKNDV